MNNLWRLHSNINEYLRFADAKAGAIIGLAGISFTFVLTKEPIVRRVVVDRGCDYIAVVICILFGAYLISSFIAMYKALSCIWPRLGDGQTRSKLFFFHISQDYGQHQDKYRQYWEQMSEDELKEDLANQIVETSKIASRKFILISQSIRWFVAAALLWIVSFILLAVLS